MIFNGRISCNISCTDSRWIPEDEDRARYIGEGEASKRKTAHEVPSLKAA